MINTIHVFLIDVPFIPTPQFFPKMVLFPHQLKIYLEKPKQFPAFVASTDNCQEIFIYYLRDLLKRLFVRKSIPGNENTG